MRAGSWRTGLTAPIESETVLRAVRSCQDSCVRGLLDDGGERHELPHLAEDVDVGSLLGELGKCHSDDGHRDFLQGQVWWVAPQTYPDSTMATPNGRAAAASERRPTSLLGHQQRSAGHCEVQGAARSLFNRPKACHVDQCRSQTPASNWCLLSLSRESRNSTRCSIRNFNAEMENAHRGVP
jgi:hypothetical protein